MRINWEKTRASRSFKCKSFCKRQFFYRKSYRRKLLTVTAYPIRPLKELDPFKDAYVGAVTVARDRYKETSKNEKSEISLRKYALEKILKIHYIFFVYTILTFFFLSRSIWSDKDIKSRKREFTMPLHPAWEKFDESH